ncbi:DUF58 domain-containing protein [Desulfobacterales bacterium HSG16]|nr:DUF58 domain-containing protein [Desulfobacterales bacterium HSG16]
MKYLLYLNYRAFYSVIRWFLLHFSKPGLFVLIGVAASAVIGIDTRQTLAYQVFTFLLSIVTISIVCSIFFRGRFSVNRILPKFGTAQSPLVYRVVIENQGRQVQKGLYLFDRQKDPRPDFESFKTIEEPYEKSRNLFDRIMKYHRWKWLIEKKQYLLPEDEYKKRPVDTLIPGISTEIKVEVVPCRRGRLNLTEMNIICPDPLGLFRAVKTIVAPNSIMILPKRYKLPPIDLPGTRKHQSGGMALTESVGESEEFVSLRDYRPGDPLHRIHWRSWAKTGKPVVKEYQKEFFVRHALVLDTFTEKKQHEVFEEAVSVAASFACTVRTRESLLDLMFIGTKAYCFTSGRGLGNTSQTLELLAAVRPCTDKPFSTLPPQVFSRVHMLSGCICVLIGWDKERQAFIEKLNGLGVSLKVILIEDENMPFPGDMIKAGPGLEIIRLVTGKIQEGFSQL